MCDEAPNYSKHFRFLEYALRHSATENTEYFCGHFFYLPVKRKIFLTDFTCILKPYLFSCAFLRGTGFRFLSPRVAVFPPPTARTHQEASGSNGRNLQQTTIWLLNVKSKSFITVTKLNS